MTKVDKEELNPQLVLATKEGDVENVKTLLFKGADVNHVSNELVPDDWDSDVGSVMLRTPLDLACELGHDELVRLLIHYGASVEGVAPYVEEIRAKTEKYHTWVTPLAWAILREKYETARLVMEKGADPNTVFDGPYGTRFWCDTASEIASHKGDVQGMTLLVEKGAKINSVSSAWYGTPLIAAAVEGHAEVVKYLLGQGADVNLPTICEETPLHKISAFGINQVEIGKLLIQAGADLNIVGGDEGGGTVLEYACYWQCGDEPVEIVELLLKNGANPNINANDDGFPLIIAIESSCSPNNLGSDLVKLLLRHGAHPHIRTSPEGKTPLMLAVESGDYQLVEIILEYKPDIDARNNEGRTALMMAVTQESETIVRQLATAGADLEIVDTSGETAVSMAERIGNANVLEVLRSKRAFRSLDELISRIGQGGNRFWNVFDQLRENNMHNKGIDGLCSLLVDRFGLNFWTQACRSSIVSKEDAHYELKKLFHLHDPRWLIKELLGTIQINNILESLKIYGPTEGGIAGVDLLLDHFGIAPPESHHLLMPSMVSQSLRRRSIEIEQSQDRDDAIGCFSEGCRDFEGLIKQSVFAWSRVLFGKVWTDRVIEIIRKNTKGTKSLERLSFGDMIILLRELPKNSESSENLDWMGRRLNRPEVYYLQAEQPRRGADESFDVQSFRLVQLRNKIAHRNREVDSVLHNLGPALNRASVLVTNMILAYAIPRVVSIEKESTDSYGRRQYTLITDDNYRIRIFSSDPQELGRTLFYFRPTEDNRSKVPLDPLLLDPSELEQYI